MRPLNGWPAPRPVAMGPQAR